MNTYKLRREVIIEWTVQAKSHTEAWLQNKTLPNEIMCFKSYTRKVRDEEEKARSLRERRIRMWRRRYYDTWMRLHEQSEFSYYHHMEHRWAIKKLKELFES